MAFQLVSLRFFHGGVLQQGTCNSYVGGTVTEYIDRDIDMLSYFELTDYVKELGYDYQSCCIYVRPPNNVSLVEIKCDKDIMDICQCLSTGDILEVFVSNNMAESDSVDNNMAESFNAWILKPRHKTIITMLEEIRVKMMNRIKQMRDFCNSWDHDISSMAMKILGDNTRKSMKCKLEFNGDTGFQVVEGDYGHKVDLRNLTCSCRAWMLKGIPCAHAIAALHHRKLEPVNYIDSCYTKETYLKMYSNFIQPCLGMKMWPESQNLMVIPPQVKRMPGRPKKVRRREPTENKTGKMSKRGMEMTCSTCHGKGHNKKGCHKGGKAAAAAAASGSTTSAQQSSVTGNVSSAAPEAKRGRGRPKGSKEKNVVTINEIARKAFKRPRMVGMGVLHTQSGFTIQNPGMNSTRFKNVRRSEEVTGDLGHTLDIGVKWKGKAAITSRGLQQLRGKKVIETRQKVANLSQASSTTQLQDH